MPDYHIRLRRRICIDLPGLDEEAAEHLQQQFAQAQDGGHGLIISEHRGMHVVERGGMSTGVVRSTLRVRTAADVGKTLNQHQQAPEDGVTLIAVLPAEALQRAELVEAEPEPV